jgi:CelD/BcsL family acetyltransferase involved in cellulose biosynthesis
LPGDWESFLSNRLGSNTRQKIRRFLRKTDAGEDFRISHADTDTFARDLDILLDLWGIMWDEEKGDDAREIKKVNRLMLTACFDDGALYLPVMWQGDRPLGALAIVADDEKKSFLFKIAGRDETFNGPPPGFILHAHAIRHAIENGMRRYDFLPGNDAYKYTFGATDRRVRNVAIQTRNGRNLNKTLERLTLARAVAMAERLRQTGKLAEAERAYRQILDTEPGLQPAVLGLVTLLETKGDRRGAKKLLASLPEST